MIGATGAKGGRFHREWNELAHKTPSLRWVDVGSPQRGRLWRPLGFGICLIIANAPLFRLCAIEQEGQGHALPALRFYGLRGTHVSTGSASYLGDSVVGQIDRRMRLARLPNSLAFSDMPRM